MRLKRAFHFLALVSSSLAFAPASVSHATEAASCDIKMRGGSAPWTEENKAKKALEDRVNARFEKDGRKSALYFVFKDANGNEEIVAQSIPSGEADDRFDIPESLKARLQKAGPVKIFNRTLHKDAGMAGSEKYASMYFMPYSVSGLSGVNVKSDFGTCANCAVHIGGGCSVVDLKFDRLSIVYSSVTKYADLINDVDRLGKKASKVQLANSEEAEAILNKKFNVRRGGRSPSSTAAAVVADDNDVKVEKRKAKHLGSDGTETKTKNRGEKSSGSGN